MQKFLYFCAVKSILALILLVVNFSLEDIIGDIYSNLTEFSEVDYEQLQTDLYALNANPIDLNNTSDEDLQQLYFLSSRQIDDILAYADRHPFESVYELRMIPSLTDYEIRNLAPFVRVSARTPEHNNMYAREVFTQAKHEIITRVDARNIEAFEGTDPVYAQLRYRFDYKRKVLFGGQLRRPVGGKAEDLQYGAYLQLKDIAPHVHTIVGGNYQASFGQGLVIAPVFHSGKSMYVAAAGQQKNGLRYYSSADGAGLHGAGGTFRWAWGKQTRMDVSALYSMNRYKDTTWHHAVGANITLRHKKLELQLTGMEHIYSDSIHPYRNANYNRHYFRGSRQAVLGASARYNYGWFDAFAEVATTQKSQVKDARWGFGTIVGSRFYPTDGVSLIALYRYYSPWFDNEYGYAFSETSRIGDENGGYLGFDVTRLKNWRFSGYGDVFYFSGHKYGLGNDTATIGYDVLANIAYTRQNWRIDTRLRARKKGNVSTYSIRALFEWHRNGWSLRTTADANYVESYGISLAQDIAYDFQKAPLSLRLRLQGFDARKWENRIYLYEHDVLYAFAIPATYGLGGRAYLCMRWQIIPQLALYLRVSETVYSDLRTKTDVHFLLRTTL